LPFKIFQTVLLPLGIRQTEIWGRSFFFTFYGIIASLRRKNDSIWMYHDSFVFELTTQQTLTIMSNGQLSSNRVQNAFQTAGDYWLMWLTILMTITWVLTTAVRCHEYWVALQWGQSLTFLPGNSRARFLLGHVPKRKLNADFEVLCIERCYKNSFRSCSDDLLWCVIHAERWSWTEVYMQIHLHLMVFEVNVSGHTLLCYTRA